jgi:hypothetical protein
VPRVRGSNCVGGPMWEESNLKCGARESPLGAMLQAGNGSCRASSGMRASLVQPIDPL